MKSTTTPHFCFEKRYRRATWEKSSTDRNTRTKIESSSLKFSLSLPEGFGEKIPLFNPEEHSVVKNYSDADGVRTILVAIVPLESKASDDTGEWIASMGKVPVGKNHTDGFAFSVTAKDSHANVMEAYSIEKKRKARDYRGRMQQGEISFFQGYDPVGCGFGGVWGLRNIIRV